jgi:hypothetical protein
MEQKQRAKWGSPFRKRLFYTGLALQLAVVATVFFHGVLPHLFSW